ncbi:hypothetical protein ABZ470_39785 [Streptosporangium sp. NPDC020072]|uniref:hypothetical protein n=1 Tax=Streptosporangium sp. NPDC020072 TaxID=3154788 RepID=UPI0034376A3F
MRFKDCICPVQPCGGVAEDDMRDDCPGHGLNSLPALQWHSADRCRTMTGS